MPNPPEWIVQHLLPGRGSQAEDPVTETELLFFRSPKEFSSSIRVQAIPGGGIGETLGGFAQVGNHTAIRMFVPERLNDESKLRKLAACFSEALFQTQKNGPNTIGFWGLDSVYATPNVWFPVLEQEIEAFKERWPRFPIRVSVADLQLYEAQLALAEDDAGDSAPVKSVKQDQKSVPSQDSVQTSADTVEPGASDDADSSAEPEPMSPKEEPIQWVQGQQEHGAKIVKGRYLIGEPTGTFNQIPFFADQVATDRYRPDLAGDIVQVENAQVLAASFRGTMHYYTGVVRQDSFAIGSVEDTSGTPWAIAAIADGVSEAKLSHQFADYVSQQAVILIKEVISSTEFETLQDIDWPKVAAELTKTSRAYCEKRSQGKIPASKWLELWATTLELAVVQAGEAKNPEFLAMTVAGDGASYVLNPDRGWRTLKSGKAKSEALASNAVIPLPLDAGAPIINHGFLETGDMLVLVTDGIDRIGTGDSAVGGFLQEKLPGARSLVSYLHVTDVVAYQLDDDRTIVTIRVDE